MIIIKKKKHNNLGSKIRQCLCLGTRRRLWGTPLGVLRGESCCGSTRVGVAAAAGGGRSCWDNTQLQRSVFLAGVDKANAVSGGSFFPVFFLPCQTNLSICFDNPPESLQGTFTVNLRFILSSLRSVVIIILTTTCQVSVFHPLQTP